MGIDMGLTIYEGDNLSTLQRLAAAGARFDLVEVDGPYGANLEEWDSLSEGEYIAHYAARLPWVSQMLQPWGVAFVFGYPEGCAEIKAWARHTQSFALLRWLTWWQALALAGHALVLERSELTVQGGASAASSAPGAKRGRR